MRCPRPACSPRPEPVCALVDGLRLIELSASQMDLAQHAVGVGLTLAALGVAIDFGGQFGVSQRLIGSPTLDRERGQPDQSIGPAQFVFNGAGRAHSFAKELGSLI